MILMTVVLVLALKGKLNMEHIITIIENMKKSVSYSFGKVMIVFFFSAVMFFTFSGKAGGQDVVNNELVYLVADEMPVFPGEMKALNEALGRNLVYPETLKEQGIEGKVLVKFIIDKEGNIKNPVVVRSVDPLLDKAALDAVKKLPRFRPGKIAGSPVSVWYSIPITFRLS